MEKRKKGVSTLGNPKRYGQIFVPWSRFMERVSLVISARRGDKHTAEDPLDHYVSVALTVEDRVSWSPDREERTARQKTEREAFLALLKEPPEGDIARLLDGRVRLDARGRNLGGEAVITNRSGKPASQVFFYVPYKVKGEDGERLPNTGKGEVVRKIPLQSHVLGAVIARCVQTGKPSSRMTQSKHRSADKEWIGLMLMHGGNLGRISTTDASLIGPRDLVIATADLEIAPGKEGGRLVARSPIMFVLLAESFGVAMHRFMQGAEPQFRPLIEKFCRIIPRSEGERFEGLRVSLADRVEEEEDGEDDPGDEVEEPQVVKEEAIAAAASGGGGGSENPA